MTLSHLPKLLRLSLRYRRYIKNANKIEQPFGFNVRRLLAAQPLLGFLYEDWWKVQLKGLDRLPADQPALIVGNSCGLVPWPALMLIYAAMSHKKNPRRINIVADIDWIEEEHIRNALLELGVVPYSSANLKQLFAANELVAIFPEGLSAVSKPFAERYRVREFDWTRLLPAVEEGIKIFPMATIGCDEAIPNILSFDNLKKWLGSPIFAGTPFFPWLPFPINFASLPVRWSITIAKPTSYEVNSDRDQIENAAKQQCRFVEGEIQAEINRLLRARSKTIG